MTRFMEHTSQRAVQLHICPAGFAKQYKLQANDPRTQVMKHACQKEVFSCILDLHGLRSERVSTMADCPESHKGSNRGKRIRTDGKISGWFRRGFAGFDVRCKRLVHGNPKIL